MSISSVSSAPVFNASQAARPAPLKKDKDGDYDNGARDSVKQAAAESSNGSRLLNIKA
jgi:hypothetical protein